jgi:hypothetical protein
MYHQIKQNKHQIHKTQEAKTIIEKIENVMMQP